MQLPQSTRSDPSAADAILHEPARELEDLKFAIDQATIVSIANPAGEITYANDKFLEISKYQRHELLGKNHRELNSGLHPKEFFQQLWETVLAGKIWHGEVRDKAKDGTFFWTDSTIVPFLGTDGRPYQFMCIRKDITERKQAEFALEDERAKRIAMERLTAVGEMAAGIAHEIRNPLSAILLQAQLLKRGTRGDASELAARTGDRIEATAKRIEKIITGLQALARNADQDPMEEVSVDKIFGDLLDFCQEGLAKKGVQISVGGKGKGEDLRVACRVGQILQVFLNLVNNARDAIDPLEEKWIRLEACAQEGFAVLSVTDSGHGIPAELRRKLMEPFFTTKARGKGTGLGLNLSRRILESHGGTLCLDESCANTRFECRLPKSRGGDTLHAS